MKWEQGPPRHGHTSHKLPSCADCWREEAAAERVRGDRLAGRLAAMADHHDAEHERCARRALAADPEGGTDTA